MAAQKRPHSAALRQATGSAATVAAPGRGIGDDDAEPERGGAPRQGIGDGATAVPSLSREEGQAAGGDAQEAEKDEEEGVRELCAAQGRAGAWRGGALAAGSGAGTNSDSNPRLASRLSAGTRVFYTHCHLYLELLYCTHLDTHGSSMFNYYPLFFKKNAVLCF